MAAPGACRPGEGGRAELSRLAARLLLAFLVYHLGDFTGLRPPLDFESHTPSEGDGVTPFYKREESPLAQCAQWEEVCGPPLTWETASKSTVFLMCKNVHSFLISCHLKSGCLFLVLHAPHIHGDTLLLLPCVLLGCFCCLFVCFSESQARP